MEAVSLGVTNLTTIRNEYHKIVQEHLKQAFVQEHDVCIKYYLSIKGLPHAPINLTDKMIYTEPNNLTVKEFFIIINLD